MFYCRILGPIVGIIGCMQALEVIKLVTTGGCKVNIQIYGTISSLVKPLLLESYGSLMVLRDEHEQ